MLPTSRAGKEPEQLLECSVGQPSEIKVTVSGDDQHDSKRSSGVLSLDIHPSQIPCNLGGIRFKNYYTGFVTMKVKVNTQDDEGNHRDGCFWKTCLHQYQLMPNSHCETASQDYFTIRRNEMSFPPMNVMMVRLILQQPSPVWITFKVEEIALLSDRPQEEESKPSVLDWLHEQGDYVAEEESSGIQRDSSSRQISEHMHKLWALTETIQINQQTQSSLGRFDVDGSYEINLLSYT